MTSGGRAPVRLVVLAVVALALLGGAGGLAYLFLREAPPPPVGAGSTAAAPTPSAGPAASVAGSAAPSSAANGGAGTTWTVDTTIGSFADFSSSFVGYRVDETLAGNKANTAVGRTPVVSGSLTLDRSTVTSVQVVADLTRLVSDDSRRDGQLRNQAIQTSQFPNATFNLTAPIDLGAVPADGSTFDVQAIGELTLHGVTRSVAIPLRAVVAGDVVTVTGSIDIVVADYDVVPPTSFVVLSIEDHGIMELQLHFRRT
jgi:polyisoprenoid-binding protein YceI